MTGLENLDPNVKRQFTGAYGPFVAGDYAIGDQVHTVGKSGEVVWSYQAKRGLTYVIDDHSGWPAEVLARRVISK